jgi:tRNA threonylcarbamoyladenosine biosynthesis protein TsaE
MNILNNYQISDLPDVSKQIIELAQNHKIWTFNGEMGAGKTTLIKAVCATLGVIDEVSSPTFSMVNEYKTTKGETVFHFDFYRIKSLSEAYDLGIEDYFDSGNICLIEWPSMIEAILENETTFNIFIELTENKRQITVK